MIFLSHTHADSDIVEYALRESNATSIAFSSAAFKKNWRKNVEL